MSLTFSYVKGLMDMSVVTIFNCIRHVCRIGKGVAEISNKAIGE